MYAKWMKQWGLVAGVLVLAPLLAVAQPRPREARPNRSTDQYSRSDRSRGDMQVVNDWRDEVSLSLWSDNRERIGEWTIRPGENVLLQEHGERLQVRPNYKMKVGEDWGWVDVGQVAQFQNGTWYVTVRNVWQATHRDRPEGYDGRRGEVSPRDQAPPRGEDSALDQILKRFK
jgi:hypothetical protein